VIGFAACDGAQAQAQQVAATDSTGLEEIVVQAEKRSENIQDVPVAVSAYTGAQLEAAGIQNAIDLPQIATGLTITSTGGAVLPFLRGVGNDASTVGNEASVAVYLDGVYQPRLSPAILELADIDRIEVLKGPQGTLFGRNASGGLIGIYTREPTQTPTAEVTVGIDNYETQLYKAFLSGGITDNLTADISALHSDQGEGWGTNFATHQKWGYENYDVYRTKWVWDVDDDTKVHFIADYEHAKGDYSVNANLWPDTEGGYYHFPGFNYPTGPRLPAPFYDVNNAYQNSDTNEGWSTSVRIDHDFHFLTASSISSYQSQYENVSTGGTGSDIADNNYHLITHDRTVTEELQLNSEKGSPFDWVVGAYYMNAFAGYEPTQSYGPAAGAIFFGLPSCLTCEIDLYGTQRINDYSAYGQATFHVLSDTDVTLGVRYTYDDVVGRGDTQAVLFGNRADFGAVREEARFYKPTFRVALEHHFTDDVMGYISQSRGFKAGTFNTLPLSAAAASPEVLDATEIGEKAQFLDHTLQLNSAFFYYQIHNPQVQTVVNGAVNIVNAGAAEVKGVDIDGQYKIMPTLQVHASAEYLDATYTSYQDAPTILPNPAFPYGNLATASADATGNDLPRAPRFSYNIGLNYWKETPFGGLNFVTNYTWNSGFAFDPDNIDRQRSYGLLDASLSYTLPDNDQWRVMVYGKNLTAVKYIQSELEQGGIPGNRYYPGAPLTFGAQVTFLFAAASESPAPTAAPAPPPAPAAPPPAPAIEAKRSFQVFFDFDKSNITDAAAKVIQAAADAVKAGHVVQLTVTGHTDTVGSSAYNQGLSERRAASVKTQLVTDGVAGGEITTIGVGKTGLLVPTADGVREPQNRRAEIVLQ
jgi:iron complex outermembrane receptor protein